MARLTEEEKILIGCMVEPFERVHADKRPNKYISDGEIERSPFEDFIYDGEDNGYPDDIVYVTDDEVKTQLYFDGRCKEKCYLWVIDDFSIKFIREKTSNAKRSRHPEFVCHTNLTGGSRARIGGEIFFCEDGRIFINHFSDRYGHPSDEQWEATKSYLRSTGYQNLIDLVEILKEYTVNKDN